MVAWLMSDLPCVSKSKNSTEGFGCSDAHFPKLGVKIVKIELSIGIVGFGKKRGRGRQEDWGILDTAGSILTHCRSQLSPAAKLSMPLQKCIYGRAECCAVVCEEWRTGVRSCIGED